MLTRHGLPTGSTGEPPAPNIGHQDPTPVQSSDAFRRVVLKWRRDAWLPEPGWLFPLLDDGHSQDVRWIVVSAYRTDEPDRIEVDLRRE
jgi:hypothetical protein